MEAHTGYSRFYLNRIFSEVTGCTIHRYIMEREADGEAAKKAGGNGQDDRGDIRQADYQSQQAFTLRYFGGFTAVRRWPTGSESIFTPLREQTKQKKTGNTAYRKRTESEEVRGMSLVPCDRDDVKGERSYDLFSRLLKDRIIFWAKK